MRAKEIREYLDSLPIASSHSHHLPDHEHMNLSLAKLLQNSYVAEKWIGNPTPTCAEEVDSWLERIRTRNFFIYQRGPCRSCIISAGPYTGIPGKNTIPNFVRPMPIPIGI